MSKRIGMLFFTLWFVLQLAACTGTQTFTNAARPGDTISLALGQMLDATRNNSIFRIQDASGNVTTYKPGDPRVRAIVNLYPDPLSYLSVGEGTDLDIRTDETYLAYLARTNARQDVELALTTAFIDLPASMAPGVAKIDVMFNNGETIYTRVNVQVLDGIGEPHSFPVLYEPTGNTDDERIQTLERAPYYTMKIAGPSGAGLYALEARFSHLPDVDNGGVGRAYVVSPKAEIASAKWRDDGSNLHVLMAPATATINKPMKNLKYYIAGGIQGLIVNDVKAFDVDGNELPGYSIQFGPLINSTVPEGPVSPGSILTISGEHFCDNCADSDNQVWLFYGSSWYDVTQNLITHTSNTVAFQVPAGVPSGDMVVWIANSVSETDKIIAVQ